MHTKANLTQSLETNLPPAVLPATGFLRIHQIIGKRSTTPGNQGIPALVPVSRATWWAGVKSGRYPRPVKLSAKATAWRVEDIRSLIERIGGAA